MRQPRLIVWRVKFKGILSLLRKMYFKCLGLKLGQNVDLGSITCLWPANVKIGNEAIIQDGVDFRIGSPYTKGTAIEIGERVFIGRYCEFNCSSKITVGNDTKIASNTTLVDVGHAFSERIAINQQEIISKEIIIGEDVWIGTGCKILLGVTIGRGSIIGAGSVVNKSIPENQVWVGSPAKFVKNRFKNETI
jgi:acetyltransferase-like isoleucine patch superfamily enzyme